MLKALKTGRQAARIEVEGRFFTIKEHTARQADKFQDLLTDLFNSEEACSDLVAEIRAALKEEDTTTGLAALLERACVLLTLHERAASRDDDGLTPGEKALVALMAYVLGKDEAGSAPDPEWLLESISTRVALEIVDAQHALNSYDAILGNLLSRSKLPAAAAKAS